MNLSIVLVIVCQSDSGYPVSEERSTVRVGSRIEEEIAYGRYCRAASATLRRPPVMLSKGERYRLDCIIIKWHKGRSEVKRLLTIAEDSRLIAHITREVTLSLPPPLSLSLSYRGRICLFALLIVLTHTFFAKPDFSCETSQHSSLVVSQHSIS